MTLGAALVFDGFMVAIRYISGLFKLLSAYTVAASDWRTSIVRGGPMSLGSSGRCCNRTACLLDVDHYRGVSGAASRFGG